MTATLAKPSLREIVIDALNEAYWSRRANVEECRACAKQPTGFALCHEEDAELARLYEQARKQIEGSLASEGTTAEIAALFLDCETGGNGR
jgi:hypothetical protein